MALKYDNSVYEAIEGGRFIRLKLRNSMGEDLGVNIEKRLVEAPETDVDINISNSVLLNGEIKSVFGPLKNVRVNIENNEMFELGNLNLTDDARINIEGNVYGSGLSMADNVRVKELSYMNNSNFNLDISSAGETLYIDRVSAENCVSSKLSGVPDCAVSVDSNEGVAREITLNNIGCSNVEFEETTSSPINVSLKGERDCYLKLENISIDRAELNIANAENVSVTNSKLEQDSLLALNGLAEVDRYVGEKRSELRVEGGDCKIINCNNSENSKLIVETKGESVSLVDISSIDCRKTSEQKDHFNESAVLSIEKGCKTDISNIDSFSFSGYIKAEDHFKLEKIRAFNLDSRYDAGIISQPIALKVSEADRVTMRDLGEYRESKLSVIAENCDVNIVGLRQLGVQAPIYIDCENEINIVNLTTNSPINIKHNCSIQNVDFDSAYKKQIEVSHSTINNCSFSGVECGAQIRGSKLERCVFGEGSALGLCNIWDSEAKKITFVGGCHLESSEIYDVPRAYSIVMYDNRYDGDNKRELKGIIEGNSAEKAEDFSRFSPNNVEASGKSLEEQFDYMGLS